MIQQNYTVTCSRLGVESLKGILLLDDDRVSLKVCTALLEFGHKSVVGVSNAADAIRAFHERYFDLLVADVVLPASSGSSRAGNSTALNSPPASIFCQTFVDCPCPLPTHGSEQSRESFGVDTSRNVWACHSASCCQARHGKVGGNILDLIACMEVCSIREAALQLRAWSDASRETGRQGKGWRLAGRQPTAWPFCSSRCSRNASPYI